MSTYENTLTPQKFWRQRVGEISS